MASAHTDLVRRHRRIIRYRLQKLNEQRNSNYKLGQKNVDLLFYLNYIRFVKALDAKAQQIASVEGSSEVMSEHWKASGETLLDGFEKEGKLH